jgi:hypothetical protein
MSTHPFFFCFILRGATNSAKLITLGNNRTTPFADTGGTNSAHHAILIKMLVANPSVAAVASIEVQARILLCQTQSQFLIVSRNNWRSVATSTDGTKEGETEASSRLLSATLCRKHGSLLISHDFPSPSSTWTLPSSALANEL